MSAHRFFRFAAMCLVVVSAGCAVKPPIAARAEPYQREQIHLASEDLRNQTTVDAPILSRDDAGLLYVTVGIRAATNLKLYIDYRATFFDGRGQVINQTGWFHKTLTPNLPDQFVVNSTSPLAKDFQIDLRYAE